MINHLCIYPHRKPNEKSMRGSSIAVRLDRLVLSSDKNFKFLKSANQTNSLAQLYWDFPSAVKLTDATSFLRPLLAMISQDSEQSSEPNAKGASGLNLSPIGR